MKYLTLICARSGSKGIKNKNIKIINSHPLISWTISIAKKIKKCENLIVSTNSKKIRRIAIKYGAVVPFLRPKNLSGDNSPEWFVWRHALNYMENKHKTNYDAVIVLPVTSPLRKKKDVILAINEFEEKKPDAVISVKHASRNPYYNMVKINKNGNVEIINKSNNTIINRQNAPQIFDMTTVVYIISKDFLRKKNNLFNGKVNHIIIPNERAIDIDEKYDFKIAEFLLSSNKYKIK